MPLNWETCLHFCKIEISHLDINFIFGPWKKQITKQWFRTVKHPHTECRRMLLYVRKAWSSKKNSVCKLLLIYNCCTFLSFRATFRLTWRFPARDCPIDMFNWNRAGFRQNMAIFWTQLTYWYVYAVLVLGKMRQFPARVCPIDISTLKSCGF